MIKITTLWRYAVVKQLRQLYSVWRINSDRIGPEAKIDLPFHLEGRGQFALGARSRIKNFTTVGCATGSGILFGSDCRIGEWCEFRTAEAGSIEVGNHCEIGARTMFQTNSRIEMGENCAILSNCQVAAREPGKNGVFTMKSGSGIGDFCVFDLSADLHIGNQVAVGPGCVIYTHDHDHRTNDGVAWAGDIVRKAVTIHDGAWIGTKVVILPGVTIGKGAVVAAGAVVTRDVGDFEIVGGVPAKPIGKRQRAEKG